MGISIHKIKKWFNMMFGNSVYHVNQNEGKCYAKDNVRGYYNNLIEKVTRFGNEDHSVPTTIIDSGEKVYFSIEIFQYGLGAYDLFLINKEEDMRNRMLNCAEWAVHNQKDNGSWITFEFDKPEYPYSSMAQGEGVSLLIRAHLETQNIIYLQAAEKALRFMLTPIAAGGTSLYQGNNIVFYEYTDQPIVLNGWIFSIWGLYDYYKYTGDIESKEILERTLNTLKRMLSNFDIKYWSKYDEGKRICSPFYHKLHIAQLRVMHDLFGDDIYQEYADKWDGYQKNIWKSTFALIKKGIQKIKE